MTNQTITFPSLPLEESKNATTEQHRRKGVCMAGWQVISWHHLQVVGSLLRGSPAYATKSLLGCKGWLMIQRFFKPKAELEVRTRETCLPGVSLPVEVVVCLQEQLKPREVRLELVGEESYYVQETQAGPKGQTHIQTVQRVNAFTRVPYTVLEQPSLTPGVEASREVTIQIPIDAPPSCRGKVVDVHWTLKAVLDVPGRRDQVRELPLQVMRSPFSARQDNEARIGLPAAKSLDDCSLTLDVPRMVAAKGVVSGRLQLKAQRKFQVRGIRVELVRQEDAGAEQADDVVAHQDLSGSVSFNATESPSFAFSLPLPSVVAPTMVSPHSSLRWQVRAVLDRRMRSDFNIEQDVFIYNAPE